MYVQQADLTRGVGQDFVKHLRDISEREDRAEGDFLFRRGEPAKHAFLLLMGRVNLKIGETGQVVHIVSRPGETFGWSSLVGRDSYSMTAQCVAPTKLRTLNVDSLQGILEKDPANGLIFFRQLAMMLGERLLEGYARYEKMFSGETYV